MAQYQIIFWRDIPSQVIVSAGGRRGAQVKKQLTERFEKSIDRAAMAGKADATDDYLAEWKKSEPVDCDDDLEKTANDLAAELEKNYPTARLDALIAAAGYNKQ